MINLPVWIAGLFAFLYVLGILLSGLGAVLANRGSKKTEDIRITLNGRLEHDVKTAYEKGYAEGKIDGLREERPHVIINPILQKDNDI